MNTTPTTWRYIRSGTVGGAGSAFIFAIIHHLFISDIWFSLPVMMAAGAACGLCIAWTYGLLFEDPSLRSWVRYNMLYVTLFVLLGVASILIYEPITTIPALIEANEPPRELFRRAMPMTIVFTLAMTTLMGLRYGQSWRHYGALLLTCTLLVLLLGLNVSVLGLVYIPSGSIYLIIELFILILALNVVYAAVFAGLERKSLKSGEKPA